MVALWLLWCPTRPMWALKVLLQTLQTCEAAVGSGSTLLVGLAFLSMRFCTALDSLLFSASPHFTAFCHPLLSAAISSNRSGSTSSAFREALRLSLNLFLLLPWASSPNRSLFLEVCILAFSPGDWPSVLGLKELGKMLQHLCIWDIIWPSYF